MASQVDHLLLTRFNLPSGGAEDTIRVREGWLEDRVELFQRYCLPSVRAQRAEGLRWIIYFDPASPSWLRDWIESNCADTFVPVFRAAVSRSELLSDLDMVFPRKAQGLVTTNLDNDDGLGLDFSGRLRALPAHHPRTAVYFGHGLIKHGRGVYLRTDRENAFCSVREDWDDPVTCWTDWHNRLHLSMPVEVIGGRPEWLQVIHDTNVSNRVRGRRVDPGPYLQDFIGIEDAVAPSTGEAMRDRLLGVPVRATRDGLRGAARRGAVALLGKDGIDRVKARLARPGRR